MYDFITVNRKGHGADPYADDILNPKESKRVLPPLVLFRVKDPAKPDHGVIPVPEEYLDKKVYREITEVKEFKKHFSTSYHNTVAPYLGNHFKAFIKLDHPHFVSTEDALVEKREYIKNSGKEVIVYGSLSMLKLNIELMTIEEVKKFTDNIVNKIKDNEKKNKLIDDSGVGAIVRMTIKTKNTTVDALSEEEVKNIVNAEKKFAEENKKKGKGKK